MTKKFLSKGPEVCLNTHNTQKKVDLIRESRGSRMNVMENSFADSCKLVHHRNVLQRDRRLTGILHYIDPEHLHHILSPSMTHQIVPDRLSSCRSETVEIEKASEKRTKQLNAFFFP